MKKITKSDLITACLDVIDEYRINKTGDIVCLRVPDAVNGVVSFKNPISLTYYPSAPAGYMILKAFYSHVADLNYYEKVSFDDVFNEVEKQIETGHYRTLKLCTFEYFISRPLVKKICEGDNKKDLLEVLKFCLSIYPHELLKSDHPEVTKLKDIFADQIHDIYYADTSDERTIARDQIFDRPKEKRSKQTAIPPYLYVEGMREHLNKIAEHLQGYCNFRYQIPRCLKKYSGDEIKLLKTSPKSFTNEQIANFFKCKSRTVKKAIDDERIYSRSPEDAPPYLLHKDQSYKRII